MWPPVLDMTAGKEAAVANVLILNEDSSAGKLVKSSNNRRPTMTFKTIATTSAALLMLAGTAFAQSQPTAPGAQKNGSGPSIQWTSDQEKMMYESNRDVLGGFFTDDTMATLKPEAEVKETFSALDMNTQGEIKKACDDAMSNRGSYGTVTTTLCTQVGAM